MQQTFLGARSAVLCDALDVQLPDESEFVAPEDVKGFLDKRYGAYIGVRLDSLDLDRIETLLESKGGATRPFTMPPPSR